MPYFREFRKTVGRILKHRNLLNLGIRNGTHKDGARAKRNIKTPLATNQHKG